MLKGDFVVMGVQQPRQLAGWLMERRSLVKLTEKKVGE